LLRPCFPYPTFLQTLTNVQLEHLVAPTPYATTPPGAFRACARAAMVVNSMGRAAMVSLCIKLALVKWLGHAPHYCCKVSPLPQAPALPNMPCTHLKTTPETADVDECAGAPCGLHSYCANSDGAYSCTCQDGYASVTGANCTGLS